MHFTQDASDKYTEQTHKYTEQTKTSFQQKQE